MDHIVFVVLMGKWYFLIYQKHHLLSNYFWIEIFVRRNMIISFIISGSTML